MADRVVELFFEDWDEPVRLTEEEATETYKELHDFLFSKPRNRVTLRDLKTGKRQRARIISTRKVS